ncbi:hypothetical protein HMPREF1987_01887 [Peptostreptococcaceae bacterium oral taxon 113 str. W5053]|nr:hypothetical protein HMPREF1987_01887 [Peptostreptococcaceae bacterium oral taxon 113 str. W5053]
MHRSSPIEKKQSENKIIGRYMPSQGEKRRWRYSCFYWASVI